MDVLGRIEHTLSRVLERASGARCPPRLAAAVRHAVFPGGARIRPRLCVAVAMACGADAHSLPVAEAAAAAIELFHCASLVHDDMPCFDDAPLRRGRPSVHAAHGEELALLAGDALIVLAFEALLLPSAVPAGERLPGLMGILCRAAGMPGGIVAGQGWESEPNPSLAEYHRAKTGILFSAATESGALAVGADPEPWQALGVWLGEAYQVADDIRDAASNPVELGKPVGRDAVLGRPSAARALGLRGALLRFNHLVAGAIASVPECPGAEVLRAMIEAEAKRLIPEEIARQAA